MSDRPTLNRNLFDPLHFAIDALSACLTMTDKVEAQAKFISVLDRVHNARGGSAGNVRFREFRVNPSTHSQERIGTVGTLARQVLNQISTTSHRKRYGQFFTPPTISALACAAAIHSPDASVIDPMCGSGAMLWAAYDRLTDLGQKERVDITGVELDALTARVAALPPDEHTTRNLQGVKVLCADAFPELSGLASNQHTINHYGRYDAIVGNPPYLRYQSLSALLKESCPVLVDAFRQQLRNAPDSVVANAIIRASLIAPLLLDKIDQPQEMAKQAIDLLSPRRSRSRQSVPFLNPAESCWLSMVATYSGLADLSLPAWLLTWLLARPGATIAYVTTGSWKNREYARFLRYFMLRMLQPLFIIEEEGSSWFEDALVQTSLMVFRARLPEEAAIPLQARKQNDHTVRFVRFRRQHHLADPTIFRRVALDWNPALADSASPPISAPFREPSACADAIVKAIEAQHQNQENELWTVNLVSEQSLVESLLHEDNAARRAGAGGICLQELECCENATPKVRCIKVTHSRHTELPQSIKQALGIIQTPTDGFRLLTDYGVTVNQGLRTGCNPFFYVSRPTADDWQRLFPDEDPSNVISILDDPADSPTRFRDIMNRLQQNGALVSEASPVALNPDPIGGFAASSSLVKLAAELGNRFAVFPNAMLQPVIRYQRTLTHWCIADPKSLPDLAVVTGAGIHPDDDATLSEYPADWRKVWRTRDHLAVLPPCLAQYISLGAQTVLKRNGQSIAIPTLSAVAPNAHQPPHPTANLSLFEAEMTVPPAPTWWYTLPLLPRHTGVVFMPRVNHDSVVAYLNALSAPVLIDANFSTFSVDRNQLPPEALFAFLNSGWVKAILEAMATPMGGGALKVEAAQVRRIAVPCLNGETITQLTTLGRSLAKLPQNSDESEEILAMIDNVVTRELATQLCLDENHMSVALLALSNDLRTQRIR